MKQLIQLPDGFGAGCFGVMLIGVGISLMTIGTWLIYNG